jgi:hypothetical protein
MLVEWKGKLYVCAFFETNKTQRIKVLEHNSNSIKFYKWMEARCLNEMDFNGEKVNFNKSFEEEAKMKQEHNDFISQLADAKILKMDYHRITGKEDIKLVMHEEDGEKSYYILGWDRDYDNWDVILWSSNEVSTEEWNLELKYREMENDNDGQRLKN